MSSSTPLESTPSAQRNALFIDADPKVHEMLVDILDPVAWNVRHVPDNKTALALAQAEHFDSSSPAKILPARKMWSCSVGFEVYAHTPG